MSSQVTSSEQGVQTVFAPQRDAEYKTLQQQIDEDASEISKNRESIKKMRRTIADLKLQIANIRTGIQEIEEDTTARVQRRTRNITRKKLVLTHHYDMLMVDEQ